MGGAIDTAYDDVTMDLLSSSGFAKLSLEISGNIYIYACIYICYMVMKLYAEVGIELHPILRPWISACLCHLLQQLLHNVSGQHVLMMGLCCG